MQLPRGVFAYLECIFDHFGIVFRTKFFKVGTITGKHRTDCEENDGQGPHDIACI